MTPVQRIERVMDAATKPGAPAVDRFAWCFLETWKKRAPEALPSRAEGHLRGLERQLLGEAACA